MTYGALWLSKCLFETAHSASSSTDVDALKFRLVEYDAFCSGQIQQDSSECFMMLLEVVNKCSVPYCGSDDNNSTGVSPSEISFAIVLEKCIVCDACWLRSPSSESSCVIYYTLSMQEWIMQQKQKGSPFDVRRALGMSNLDTFHSPQSIWFFCEIGYINNNFTKDRRSIPMYMTIVLGLNKFSPQAIINHNGPSLYSGHYAASFNCCKIILWQRQ